MRIRILPEAERDLEIGCERPSIAGQESTL